MAVIIMGLTSDARYSILGLESSQSQAQLAGIDVDCRFSLEMLQRLMQVSEPWGYIASGIDCCYGGSR